MVSFENFVKSMPPSLSELKVKPSFCFPFKIPDDLTATSTYVQAICTQFLKQTNIKRCSCLRLYCTCAYIVEFQDWRICSLEIKTTSKFGPIFVSLIFVAFYDFLNTLE